MKSIGDVIDVIVYMQRPFGIFVDMEGELNALIQAIFLYDSIPAGGTAEKSMPPIGAKLRAVILMKRKDGQYQLSLKKTHFVQFGHETEWQDWTKDFPIATNRGL